MLMDADVGEGGVKNQPKSADVVYGRPLGTCINIVISYQNNHYNQTLQVHTYFFPINFE